MTPAEVRELTVEEYAVFHAYMGEGR